MKLLYFVILVLISLVVFVSFTIYFDRLNSSPNKSDVFSDKAQENLDFNNFDELAEIDSIIVDYDVKMWAKEFRFKVSRLESIIVGRDYYDSWGKPDNLPKFVLNNIVFYIRDLSAGDFHSYIKSRCKTTRYCEGDFTQITIHIFSNGSEIIFHIDTNETQDGDLVTFSSKFLAFNTMLFKCAEYYSANQQK